MKLNYLLILSLLLISFFGCQEVEKSAFPSEVEIARLMNEEMTQSDLPAVVAIGVNKTGERVSYTHGKAVWTENEPVKTNSIFRIASMDKMLTSIAALQLVEKGKIGLDDDLSVLMPEMSIIPILSDGKLIEAKNPITLRHLLTHTSGFGYYVTDEELANFDQKGWEYKRLPRRFESGTQFLYGRSIDWVGDLIEKISGMSLGEYYWANITEPLQMNRTWHNVPDSLKEEIVSYGKRGDDGTDTLKEIPNRIPQQKVTSNDGGRELFSTPEDYTKLLLCMLNDGQYTGGQILQKATIEEMFKNQIGEIEMDIEANYFLPGLCCDFRGLIKKSSKHGLAFLIDTERSSYGREAGTALWGGLFNTYFYIDKKSGIAASIYSQHLPFNHPATTKTFERFSEILYSRIEK